MVADLPPLDRGCLNDMSRNVRPSDHEQRKSCNDAAALLLAKMGNDGKGLPEAVSTTLKQIFLPARDAYLAGYSAQLRAASVKATATRKLKEADIVFDSKGRAWNKSVLDSGGKLVPQQLERVIGVLPGKLFTLRPAREVLLTSNLFEQLPELPHLQGGAEQLAEFKAAHATLSVKVAGLKDAERIHRNATRALRPLARAFDKKWMALVSVLVEADPALAEEILPDFPSRSQKARPATPKSPKPSPIPKPPAKETPPEAEAPVEDEPDEASEDPSEPALPDEDDLDDDCSDPAPLS